VARAAEAAALAGSTRAVPLAEQRRALVLDDPVELAAACERLARYRWTSGDGAGSHSAFEEALHALRTQTPDGVRARVLAGDAWILSMSFREKEAAPLAEEALAAASRSGSPLETCRALLAWAASHPNSPESLPRLAEARRLAVDLDVADEIARAHIALAQGTRRAGRLREEVRILEEGVRLEQAHGVVSYEAVLGYFLLEVLVDLGRWDEGADLAGRLARLPVGGIVRAFGSAGRARLAALRGDPGADGAAAEAIDLARAIPQQPAPTVLAHLALAEARLWAGEPAEAQRHALEALDPAAVDPSLAAAATSLAVRAAADLAEHARRRGEPVSETTPWVRRVEGLPTAGTDITPRVLGHVATARAELSRLTTPGAAEPWREVIAAWERAEDPYAAAYARWRLARLLLGSPRPERAELAELVRAAHDSASALGARPLVAAVERVAASAGLEAARGDGGMPALTERERQVLRLLATGRTNAEMADILVISPRTVGVHVSHLLHKLGAARRTEAADVARRAGVLDD
jgi:DNA-binding NarL/FixJ family response regulator